MASINATTDRNSLNGAILVSWALGNADTGTPFAIPFAAEIAFQVTGTFGAATVTLQGSNDGTNWHPLTRKGAGTNNLAFTSANLQNAWENPAYIRAISSGGTGTAVNAIVCLKANFNKVGY